MLVVLPIVIALVVPRSIALLLYSYLGFSVLSFSIPGYVQQGFQLYSSN